MTAPTGVTRVTLLKDLRLEWRSKDAINSMLFFSLLVVVVFSFSFDPSAEESRQSEGHLRGNATLLLNDFIDARRRDSQSQCKLIRVQTEGDYKLLAKDLPRMDELALVSSHFPLSDNLRSLRRTHRLLATQSCRSRYLF